MVELYFCQKTVPEATLELTSSSHKGKDQEWIHGGRSRTKLVVESLYTCQGEGGWPPLLLVQTHLQLSLSQGLGSTLLFFGHSVGS